MLLSHNNNYKKGKILDVLNLSSAFALCIDTGNEFYRKKATLESL